MIILGFRIFDRPLPGAIKRRNFYVDRRCWSFVWKYTWNFSVPKTIPSKSWGGYAAWRRFSCHWGPQTIQGKYSFDFSYWIFEQTTSSNLFASYESTILQLKKLHYLFHLFYVIWNYNFATKCLTLLTVSDLLTISFWIIYNQIFQLFNSMFSPIYNQIISPVYLKDLELRVCVCCV